MVVACARIVNRPQEVVFALTVEYVYAFAEGIGRSVAALRSDDGSARYSRHVVGELRGYETAVAPIEVGVAAGGVGEYVAVDELAGRDVLVDERTAEVAEGACRTVGYGASKGLVVLVGIVAREIEVVAIRAVRELLLFDGRSPGIACCPGYVVGGQIEDTGFLMPVDQVGR